MDRLTQALAGRYRIERQLGAGGMATVYLAADLKHDRKVALKVLKPELAAVLGAERFVVEIKTTAALQHPHILPLFDSGEAGGFLYYVMPFVDGETLRTKLDRETQLGIEEAVGITTAVADALDYAHRHGVVHRDIKPENILLHEGRPMVADFGIALAVSAAAGGRMTETGLSLGTPHYMSPEQATAEKEITARSDVYSLASVLYEMLAGQPPHLGGSAQQIIMKIIAEPVAAVTKLRKAVPPNVAAALEQALEKLPADRFVSAAAFAAALENPSFTLRTGTSVAAGAAAGGWRQRVAVPALVATVLLAFATAWGWMRPSVGAEPVARYEVMLAGEGLAPATSVFAGSRVAVSRDGQRLVYLGMTAQGPRLMVRHRDQLESTELAGTEFALNPVFSPDGERVAFMSADAPQTIKVISVNGGPPVVVTDSMVGTPGLNWADDGFIYFDKRGNGPLLRVRESGGVPDSVSTLGPGEAQHFWPDALPNGRGVVITVNHGGPGTAGSANDEIAVLDLSTGKHRVLVRGVFAKYAASGHILYVTSDGVLMALPFDPDRLEATGEPVVVAQGLPIVPGTGAVDLAISRTGTAWYSSRGSSYTSQHEMVWLTRDGRATVVDANWVGTFDAMSLSPDGRRLAVSVTDGTSINVWVKELDRGPLSKLTFQGANTGPRWNPDGSTITYVSLQGSLGALYSVRADGGANPVPLIRPARPIAEGGWSPAGQWIVFATTVAPNRDIFAMRPGVDSTPLPLVESPAREMNPRVSPDGRWFAYESNISGRNEVYVRPFPNAGDALRQVSTDGGTYPVWSRKGDELFFVNRRNEMVAARVSGRGAFAVIEQRVLFSMSGLAIWDVAPGDQRFIAARLRGGDRGDGSLIVVENLFAELKARVKPAK